jgi:hypothetical protein
MSSGISRLLFQSPRSMRNFFSLIGICLALDLLLYFSDSARTFVNVNLYQTYLMPWASNPMFEPQVAVLSFMFACAIFTTSKFLFGRGQSINNNNNKNNNSSQNSIIATDFSSFVFWSASNVGIYLFFIYVFQRVTKYGEVLYSFNQEFNDPQVEIFTYAHSL